MVIMRRDSPLIKKTYDKRVKPLYVILYNAICTLSLKKKTWKWLTSSKIVWCDSGKEQWKENNYLRTKMMINSCVFSIIAKWCERDNNNDDNNIVTIIYHMVVENESFNVTSIIKIEMKRKKRKEKKLTCTRNIRKHLAHE